ncbi:uncharacterized protein LOC144915148 [Branchiostoma floridae x Branchiostoma belcheri]
MTGDTDWSLHLPGEGKYLCRRTDLGVVTPYPLHVTYRSANWSDRWPQVGEWMAVGPLFSIQCEDVEGPVDILLPHVLHLADATELTLDDLQVVHVVGDTAELLPVIELTPSHAVIRFKKGSLFGVVAKTNKALSVSRNGLLMAFVCLENPYMSRLKVYIVSNTMIMQENLKKYEKDWRFEPFDYTTCHLRPGDVYYLEGSVTNGEDMSVSSSPQCLLFEDTLDTNKAYEPFRVRVSSDIWSSATSQLHLELLRENRDGTKEAVSELTLESLPSERFKRAYSAEGSDSGVSTPSETTQPKSRRLAGPNRYFHFIKEAVATSWKDLAFFLGFDCAATDNISGRNPDDKSRCRDMLEEWERLKGDEATIEALMTALSEAGLQKVLDDLGRAFPELAESSGSTEEEAGPSGGASARPARDTPKQRRRTKMK